MCVGGIHHLSYKSFTHLFDKHHLSHTITDHLSHTTSLSHTQLCHTPLCHTPSSTQSRVALGDMHLRFACQAWHLETSTCIWHGRGALCNMHLRFAWQAWRLETSTYIWGNRRATWRHLPAFGVAGVALVAFGGRHFRRSVALGDIYTCVWGGRRGARRHLPAFGVAGVALGNIFLRLPWQAWLLFHLVARLVAVGFCWSPGARRHFA